MSRERVEEGVEAARRLERHLEEIADKVLTKDTMDHVMKAGSEAVQAANVALKNMKLPEESKARIHKAEREVLLAVRSFIDAILVEIDKEIPRESRKELKRIEIKRKQK